MAKTECERELVAFMSVALTARLWFKLARAPADCAVEVIGCAGPSPTNHQDGPMATCNKIARLVPDDMWAAMDAAGDALGSASDRAAP